MKNICRKTLKSFISAAADDLTLLADLKTERTALARELLTNPESGTEITSGSGNGTSFTGQTAFTKSERLAFLEYAIDAIENEQPPPNRTYGVFW